MIETSSGPPRKFTAIYGIFKHLRKFLDNVQRRLSVLRNNFGKSSKIFGKWSEIFEKSSKTQSSICLYEKDITR